MFLFAVIEYLTKNLRKRIYLGLQFKGVGTVCYDSRGGWLRGFPSAEGN